MGCGCKGNSGGFSRSKSNGTSTGYMGTGMSGGGGMYPPLMSGTGSVYSPTYQPKTTATDQLCGAGTSNSGSCNTRPKPKPNTGMGGYGGGYGSGITLGTYRSS